MTKPADSGSGEVPAVVVVSVALIVVAIVAGVVVLSIYDKSVTALLTVLGFLSPTIVALLAVRTQRKVDDVRSKVNGKLDNLITDKANLEYQVTAAGLTPVTATVSFDPESNTNPDIPVITDPRTNPVMPAVHMNPNTGEYSVNKVLRRLEEERENGR